MSDAMRVTAAGRSVCLTPGYAMAIGPFDPFAAAAQRQPWKELETWQHKAFGPEEALMSLRFAVFSRLSEQPVAGSDAVAESQLRQGRQSAGGGLLRARVSVTREHAKATKTFEVGSGGIDVFGASLRVSLLAPASIRLVGSATYPVPAEGFGALEEVWTPIVGEDGASLRPRASVHTYCAKGVRAPIPPSAVRYEVLGAEPPQVLLSAGAGVVTARSAGPVGGFRSIELDRNAVVAWEVEP